MREDPDDTPAGDEVADSSDGTDHHGQDAGRDTLSAGEAQRESGGLGTEGEQNLPAMSQNNASTDDKVEGIVAQTRVDVGGESLERIAEVLHQRLEQSGIRSDRRRDRRPRKAGVDRRIGLRFVDGSGADSRVHRDVEFDVDGPRPRRSAG